MWWLTLKLGCIAFGPFAWGLRLCTRGKDCVYLLILLRATSLGKDITSPEALVNWLALNTHEHWWAWSISVWVPGDGTWRVVEWQFRCQVVWHVVWPWWGWVARLQEGSVGLGRAGKGNGPHSSCLTSCARPLSSGNICCVSEPLTPQMQINTCDPAVWAPWHWKQLWGPLWGPPLVPLRLPVNHPAGGPHALKDSTCQTKISNNSLIFPAGLRQPEFWATHDRCSYHTKRMYF